MVSLMLNVLLQFIALGASSQDYATAYRETEATGRPLVVLIGADWCPGCQTMKNVSIPELERRGGLSKVSFAYVNSDRQQELAGKLMRGNSIPQLVVFNKTNAGWKRDQMTGAQSPAAIQSFLDRITEPAPTRLSQSQ